MMNILINDIPMEAGFTPSADKYAPTQTAYALNPDDKIVRRIQDLVQKNGGYCPCRVSKNPDTLCPCRDFREGLGCVCGLYTEQPVTPETTNDDDDDGFFSIDYDFLEEAYS